MDEVRITSSMAVSTGDENDEEYSVAANVKGRGVQSAFHSEKYHHSQEQPFTEKGQVEDPGMEEQVLSDETYCTNELNRKD